MHCRPATAGDIEAIAMLHADSWRRHYRGAYSDDFLDGDIFDDRRDVWSERLTRPDPAHDTVVAVDGGDLVGFAHTVIDEDPVWGALLDNLHVVNSLRGTGIGTQLLARSASAVLARGERKNLYLWVIEGNAAARAFYAARGGQCMDTKVSEPPGGGTIVALRCAWPEPSILIRTS